MYSLHKYFINKLIIAPILQIPDFRSDRLYTPSRQNHPDEEMPFIKKESHNKKPDCFLIFLLYYVDGRGLSKLELKVVQISWESM